MITALPSITDRDRGGDKLLTSQILRNINNSTRKAEVYLMKLNNNNSLYRKAVVLFHFYDIIITNSSKSVTIVLYNKR